VCSIAHRLLERSQCCYPLRTLHFSVAGGTLFCLTLAVSVLVTTRVDQAVGGPLLPSMMVTDSDFSFVSRSSFLPSSLTLSIPHGSSVLLLGCSCIGVGPACCNVNRQARLTLLYHLPILVKMILLFMHHGFPRPQQEQGRLLHPLDRYIQII
jgi:hypothetical protein